MSAQPESFAISVRGLVQGVGFRPCVWRIAQEMGLNGYVLNDASGVKIHLNSSACQVRDFLTRLQAEKPPLAKIEGVEVSEALYTPCESFEIVSSQQGDVSTGCAPDAATCSGCLEELFDKTNTRYRYPFINCTDCGPRLSIIRQIPYDREFTTMADFQQCDRCVSEYNNPADRRFHAQPNACPECGPEVWLENNQGDHLAAEDPFLYLRKALQEGKIIAVKGLGGFHLVCDATNQTVVDTLRQRKHRPDKAFALMVRDVEVLKVYAYADQASIALLQSSRAPVVLLDPVQNVELPVVETIAPGQYQLGFMLPYTPIHHLLLQEIEVPLVMTSGNRSGSPQAISNEDAREQLNGIADLYLMHNRAIQNRVDDSVVRWIDAELHMLRRARGYAPDSITLPPGFENVPELVALGGELKNTLCFLQAGRAMLTQHLGDLEDLHTYEQYQSTLDLYRNLYQFKGDDYVCDLHPEYLSSKFGEQLAEQGSRLLKVQHHHAHLASCLGDNAYPLSGKPVLGICLDGTGYGLDETLWGGEFLLGNYHQITRVAHIQPFPLVGGAKAIIEPWRCLYALLKQSLTADELDDAKGVIPALNSPLCATFDKMIEQDLNCPQTTSAGRLFDAVAAALGCHAGGISYEGQAAIEMETLARKGAAHTEPYELSVDEYQINPSECFKEIILDLKRNLSPEDIALAFHLGFVNAVVVMVQRLYKDYSFETIALSGGVMQNEIIYSRLSDLLRKAGFNLLTHNHLPANDGGLSFGQALIAAARLQK